MIRLLSVLLGAILCVSASSANAAFTFTFNPSSLVNAAPGSSGSFQVDIVGTGADAGGGFGYLFTLTSDNSNFTFTPSNTFTSGAFTAPSSVSVNFAVSSLATVGQTANVTGIFGASGPGGAVFGSQFSNRLTLTAITAVPEPSSIALVGLCAVAGLVVHRRRQRRQV
jgi:hypothetical protein